MRVNESGELVACDVWQRRVRIALNDHHSPLVCDRLLRLMMRIFVQTECANASTTTTTSEKSKQKKNEMKLDKLCKTLLTLTRRVRIREHLNDAINMQARAQTSERKRARCRRRGGCGDGGGSSRKITRSIATAAPLDWNAAAVTGNAHHRAQRRKCGERQAARTKKKTMRKR